MTLPFKNYIVLDSRNEKDAEKIIKDADLIILSGGHVPTENSFFNNINLRELIRKTDAFIIGISAGAMNSAENVYSPPEYESEVIDNNYNKYYKGLGLTHLNVFPHYDEIKDEVISGVHVLEKIVLPDSYDRDIYALNNGSYILIDHNEYIYGETYLIRKGKIKMICKDNQHTVNKSWEID
jgi:dipeptidase E